MTTRTNCVTGVPDFVWEENDRTRIKRNSQKFFNLSIAEAFEKAYDIKLNDEVKEADMVNTICNIELFNIYSGIVKSVTNDKIEIDLPGVKEELICKENFNGCHDAINNYLLNHDNHICFEVREKVGNKYFVSITNAYYRIWKHSIENMIKKEIPLTVHIDDLVVSSMSGKGGYVAHCPIKQLCDLTGKEYTSSVFIPGSQIVLNIENDFMRWIGKDIQIIPQTLTKFRSVGDLDENSLIGSRKKLLQITGNQNLNKIYNLYKLATKDGKKPTSTDFCYDGTITGIINSSQKTGIFVELDGEYITGLMPCMPSQLLDFQKGQSIRVRIKEFEVQEGKQPFVIHNNKIVYCNTRCIFELAE